MRGIKIVVVLELGLRHALLAQAALHKLLTIRQALQQLMLNQIILFFKCHFGVEAEFTLEQIRLRQLGVELPLYPSANPKVLFFLLEPEIRFAPCEGKIF